MHDLKHQEWEKEYREKEYLGAQREPEKYKL